MTDTTPVGPAKFPVDRAARLLMVYARQDPKLLSRSNNQPAVESHDPAFDLPALFHWRSDIARTDEGFSGELYLEELVTLASEAADRAGLASRLAADAAVALRRSRSAVTLLGTLGMLVGLVAVAGSFWNGLDRHVSIASERAAVQAPQREAARELQPPQRADQQLAKATVPQNQAVPVQAATAPPPVASAPAAAPAAGAAGSAPTDAGSEIAVTGPASTDAPPASTDASSDIAVSGLPPADAAPETAVVVPAAEPQVASTSLPSDLPATAVATRQEWSASPVSVPGTEDGAQLRPPPVPPVVHRHKYRRPVVRRVYRYYRPGPPVVLVRVVQNIQRDVGSLFR